MSAIPLRSAKIPHSALPVSHIDKLDWLRLVRSRRVGPVTFIRLVREHGSVAVALEILPSIAATSGVANYQPMSRETAEIEYAAGREIGAELLFLGAPNYPPRLATIQDPPAVLWALGDASIALRTSVAFVGARNSSSLGRRMAAKLSQDLSSEGYVIVSGLARGIDAEAHKAALNGGTIAVLAGGVDTIYPKENSALAHDILENGLRVSEMPVGLQPQARHFPRRNRIISGLAQAVLVVEGASKSGSLITAKNALDQGREVMAVPGNPMDGRAAGCNMLIRDGATLVRSAADVIEALAIPPQAPPKNPTVSPKPKRPDKSLSRTLMSLISSAPVQEDILVRQTSGSAQDVMSALLDLEVTRKIERFAGGAIAISP
ncbi:DNA protecting protein DprA [Rhodobacterales bacterium 52_120_T64]|nr:DNA protecting protein DprA [Rhodobacterales bacterium 52_120_T64]